MQTNELSSGQGVPNDRPVSKERTEASSARRADIDVLRAVAVLAVILFHFDVELLRGGFLGVDMFFVISGYLITLHLKQQLHEGSFSFLNFYARRIRRLFPALAATLVFTSVIALFVLPTALMREYAASAVASSVYVSNFYFWSIAGYFDSDSIYKPLLHTWSLSVEEQFYIFWPLFVMVFLRRHLWLAIAVAGILSVLAGLIPGVTATTAFYHFPFRVHEFAVGALLTSLPLLRLPRWSRLLLVLIAFAAVCYALMTTTETSPFPGAGSAMVVIGTALIIAVAEPLFSARSSFLQPIIRIGLTSYSAYLVHWPLVVFYKILNPGTLQVAEIALLLLATLYLGELFYQLIEQPSARIRLPRFRFAIIAMAPAILAGAVAFYFSYPMFRVVNARAVTEHASEYNVADMLSRVPDRQIKMETALRLIAERSTGNLSADRRTIVVLGDSHAEDIVLALRLNLGDDNANVVLLRSDCDPLSLESITIPLSDLYEHHYQESVRDGDSCRQYHLDLISNIIEYSPDLIVFSEAWRADALPFVRGTIENIRSATSANVLVLGLNPFFEGSPPLALNGRQFDRIVVDLECVQRCVADTQNLDLSLYYLTDTHRDDPLFRDKPTNFTPLAAGERRRLVYDMASQAVGAPDWTNSTIRRIRFDLPQGASSQYIVHSIRICATGDATCG